MGAQTLLLKTIFLTPSTQVDSILPLYVAETYKQFVKFITFADQSEERIGFGQDFMIVSRIGFVGGSLYRTYFIGWKA